MSQRAFRPLALAGGDPINFLTKRMDLKIRLQGLGRDVSNEVYLDIMLSGPTKAPEVKFSCKMHYREEFMSVDCLQERANRSYVDQQSRNASGPVVSGRGPRWRRPHLTSAIDARRAGISSVTALNKCRRTVQSQGRRSGRTNVAVVGGVLSRNGAPTITPPRTAMLRARNSRSFARPSTRSSKSWLPTWRFCIPLVRSTCPTSGALT